MTDDNEILVYIVDDDKSVRLSLEMLIISANMKVLTYESANDFLNADLEDKNACLITDIKLKGSSGLELQKILNKRGIEIPIIFLTGFDSAADRRQAQKEGAVSFFRKPVDDLALIDAINWAVSLTRKNK